MNGRELENACWPAARLGDAMSALVDKAGLANQPRDTVNPQPDWSDSTIADWMEWHAKRLGCEVEAIETTLADLDGELPSFYPSILRIPDDCYLVVLSASRGKLRVLKPDLELGRIPVSEVCDAIRQPAAQSKLPELQRLFQEANLSESTASKAVTLLLREQLAETRFHQCWKLRASPGARPLRWLREANALRKAAKLLGVHTVQYLLWIASWVILGRMSFAGQMNRGWLLAWAFLLAAIVVFRVAAIWLQGSLSIGIGGLLKRRLIAGALRLGPEEMRDAGIGTFLGQVFEAETIETLALSGGIAGLLATVEIAVSGFVLGRLSPLLLVWCGITAALGWRFFKRFQSWTSARLEMTQDTVEAMVGYRTRLVQQRPQKWHEEEDFALDRYVQLSRSMDDSAMWLIAAIPRGWLLVAIASSAPGIVTGRSTPVDIAIRLGGILLAFAGFKRLTAALADIAGACVPWNRIGPLFRAAARPEKLGDIFAGERNTAEPEKVIAADRLTFRYRSTGAPALHNCSLILRKGERVLLEGPSGGGKTTFASLLAGIREPESGLLLVNGLDRRTAGDQKWRKCVAAAPQFHENHIVTETLAFNLLMGRRWPPTLKDMEEAETLCRELGLGDLLDRMPSGLQQMVGEGGWQLSHGERSRIYMARALLQRADLVILDESFAALDPENLHDALACTLNRAETLMLIAHP